MNMRKERITTSQQEVYLIYLSDNLEFAASRIKDSKQTPNVVALMLFINTINFLSRRSKIRRELGSAHKYAEQHTRTEEEYR